MPSSGESSLIDRVAPSDNATVEAAPLGEENELADEMDMPAGNEEGVPAANNPNRLDSDVDIRGSNR